ncbi:MAG: 6,7-dimethyl-8-ribityllumazine synthase [Phycisphaerales bacterium]|nr:MAG: 6,7-dimethyl-8-ribityllumazine synthase [Phycisphaerales bacterium]
MPPEIHGTLNADGVRFAIVVARFNSFITDRLLAGALDALRRHGAADEGVTIVRVPGSFEIPPVARRLAQSGKFDAVLCLGCVIRGQTPHFEHVAGEAARGVGRVALETGVPTAFGILTCDTLEQAIERAGSKAGNKGADAAMTAIEMVNVYRKIDAM